jgi:hypothetical protein
VLQVLRVVAVLAMIVAALLRRQERRTIARLTDAGADIRERAVTLERTGSLGHLVHRRLEHAQVLVAAGNDRYYLDPSAYAAFRQRRRRRALLVLALIAMVIVLLYLRGDFS